MPITKFNLKWHIVMVEKHGAEPKAWRRFLARCKRNYIRFNRGIVMTPHAHVLADITAWLPMDAKMYVLDVTDYQVEHSKRIFGTAEA